MAKYGLLKGLGVGLSQGAVMLNQAMAEDRAVERERMREASIAQRWKRQEEREDARYADEKKYRDDRNKVEDKRYNEQKSAQAAAAQQAQSNWQKSYGLQERQMSAQEEARRVQRIEETLGRIQSKFDRDAEKIDRKYDRLLDKAETPEEKAALHDQRDREHEALGTKLNAEMLPALKSFGDGLKGTAYATYIDELAAMGKPKQEEKPGPDPVPAPSSRAGAVNSVLNQSGSQPSQADGQAQYLQPGLLSGLRMGMAGDYKPAPVDYSNITPLQRFTTAAGRAVTHFPGKLLDNAELLNDNVIQPAWAWANTPTNQGRK